MGAAEKGVWSFSGRTAVSGPSRIRGRGDSTVVFVGVCGFVEGAVTDAEGDLVEELVGLRVPSDELEQAPDTLDRYRN